MICIFFCFVHPVKEGHTCKTSNAGNERQHVSILDRALFVMYMLRKCIGKALSKQININILETQVN
jgi:hypothetical protein